MYHPPWLGLATGSTLFALAGAATDQPAIVGGSVIAVALTTALGMARIVADYLKERGLQAIRNRELDLADLTREVQDLRAQLARLRTCDGQRCPVPPEG